MSSGLKRNVTTRMDALLRSGPVGEWAVEYIQRIKAERELFHNQAFRAEKEIRSMAVQIEWLQRQLAEYKSRMAA